MPDPITLGFVPARRHVSVPESDEQKSVFLPAIAAGPEVTESAEICVGEKATFHSRPAGGWPAIVRGTPRVAVLPELITGGETLRSLACATDSRTANDSNHAVSDKTDV